MQTPEQILSTHDERIVVAKPEDMIKMINKRIAVANSLMADIAKANVGNITRAGTLSLLMAIRGAASAAQGLDEWRKKNPHPDDPRYV